VQVGAVLDALHAALHRQAYAVDAVRVGRDAALRFVGLIHRRADRVSAKVLRDGHIILHQQAARHAQLEHVGTSADLFASRLARICILISR
jgi:hypothetical protein